MQEDYGTVFSVSCGITGEEQECPGEERSGGVAAREQEMEHLIAEFGGITGLGGERVEEDVFFFLLEFGIERFGRWR